MKHVVASTRSWPYFLFSVSLLAVAGYAIISWGLSVPLVLGSIILLWILYQSILNQEVVIALEDVLVHRRGFNVVRIPWDRITNISIQQHRLDARYVIICYIPKATEDSLEDRVKDLVGLSHGEHELINHISLDRVTADPDILCEELQAHWQEFRERK